jgi:Ca2+-binding EF-hand superfamily protein
VFVSADKNKDGTLTKSEIKNYFKGNPLDKEALLGKDFHWHAFWGEMDEDGNGTFDVGEFTHMAIKVVESHP